MNNMTKEKISVITLGCSKNRVDSERMIHQLKINDFPVAEDPNDADTLIINTCGFINDAKEESVNTLLEAVERKKHGLLKRIIVAGCLSGRYPKDLMREVPEIDGLFGPEAYEDVISALGGKVQRPKLYEREISLPYHYSYLKISEGCNNKCSFCAIPQIRGKYRSKSIEDLLNEARYLSERGVKELNLIAEDSTDYGRDLYKDFKLAELIRRLSEIEDIKWLRLLYTYPARFPLEVIKEIAGNPKICKYIDLPLQHISDRVLKSMKRPSSSSDIRKLLDRIRTEIPEVALRTTFIVGYPEETEEDFQMLMDFVKEYRFERMGSFIYSREEGTSGYSLGDGIAEEVKRERQERLMELQKEISLSYNQSLIGSRKEVLLDSVEEEYYVARSMHEAPEVDGEILIPRAEGPLSIGKFYDVEITDSNEYDLYAKNIPET